MSAPSLLRISTGAVLAVAIIAGVATAPTAVAGPGLIGPVHEAPSGRTKVVSQGVKWFVEVVVEGISKPSSLKGDPGSLWWTRPPPNKPPPTSCQDHSVAADSVNGNPTRLVTFAAQSPTLDGIEHISYMQGKPSELIAAVSAGGTRVSQNEYKVGVTSVAFSAGSKTDKPYIEVSNGATSTNVIVLAN